MRPFMHAAACSSLKKRPMLQDASHTFILLPSHRLYYRIIPARLLYNSLNQPVFHINHSLYVLQCMLQVLHQETIALSLQLLQKMPADRHFLFIFGIHADGTFNCQHEELSI